MDPYIFTLRSKAALIDNLSLMLEQGHIVLPRPELWPEGIDELESLFRRDGLVLESALASYVFGESLDGVGSLSSNLKRARRKFESLGANMWA